MTDVPDPGRLFAPEVVTHPDGSISVISAKANEAITRSLKTLCAQSGLPKESGMEDEPDKMTTDRIAVFKVRNTRVSLHLHGYQDIPHYFAS